MDDLIRTMLSIREEKGSISINTDGSADAIASAAIILLLLKKLGIQTHLLNQQSLLGETRTTTAARLSIQEEAIILTSDQERMAVAPRQQQPAYQFPELSLSGLALKVVDTLFMLGELQFTSDFVAFDFETTGKNPEQDELIEIGAVKFQKGREIDTFSQFIKPRRPIPEEIIRITNIHNGMVEGAPSAAKILPEFIQFCGSGVLIAHNVPFDLAFLKRHASELMGIDIRNDTEDTLAMSRWLHPEAKSHRLGDMAASLGIETKSWHRAEEDARTAAGIYLHLKNSASTNLRELRVKHYLELAALGTIASRLPLKNENELIVKHGLRMMLRHFGLGNHTKNIPQEVKINKERLPDMLTSLDDNTRRRGALNLLAGIIRSLGEGGQNLLQIP